MSVPYRVVILGGGFAGIRVARRLAKDAGRQHVAITLVSRSGLHAYTPSLYALAGAASDTARRRELERSTALPLRRIFSGLPVSLLQAEVASVDVAQRQVALEDGRTVAFDALVIALGSEAAYYGIPGLQEHAITLKSVDDAIAISRKVGALMRGRDKPLRVTVGGGGATGVELSAMLAEGLGTYQAGAHVTLVEAQPAVLAAFEPQVREYVAKELEARGVMLRTGTRITRAEAASVILDGTEELAHDVLVWTGGIQAPAILETLPFVCDKGRLVTDAPLTCAPASGGVATNVYALGDASCFHYAGHYAPWTAHVALIQADHVAANIMRTVTGKKLKPFKLGKLPFVIPLGTTGGIGRVYLFNIHGRLNQLFAWMIEAQYLTTILPLRTALRLAMKRVRN